MTSTSTPFSFQASAAACASSIIWVRHSLPTQPFDRPMVNFCCASAPPASSAAIPNAIAIFRMGFLMLMG